MVNKDLQSAKYLLNCNLLMSLGPHSPISVWPFLSLSSQHTAAYWVNAVRARCRIRGKQLFFFFFSYIIFSSSKGTCEGRGRGIDIIVKVCNEEAARERRSLYAKHANINNTLYRSDCFILCPHFRLYHCHVRPRPLCGNA